MFNIMACWRHDMCGLTTPDRLYVLGSADGVHIKLVLLSLYRVSSLRDQNGEAVVHQLRPRAELEDSDVTCASSLPSFGQFPSIFLPKDQSSAGLSR